MNQKDRSFSIKDRVHQRNVELVNIRIESAKNMNSFGIHDF